MVLNVTLHPRTSLSFHLYRQAVPDIVIRSAVDGHRTQVNSSAQDIISPSARVFHAGNDKGKRSF